MVNKGLFMAPYSEIRPIWPVLLVVVTLCPCSPKGSGKPTSFILLSKNKQIKEISDNQLQRSLYTWTVQFGYIIHSISNSLQGKFFTPQYF